MSKLKNEINEEIVLRKIYQLRGKNIMIDADLAELYSVSTTKLNEQVKRNMQRFPVDFMFQWH
ncbi:MAG: ORF6N domain-containing protein [Crocinitomicaceae bacterium]|nr:ORF6N domain-containing protein [Crocinitomicaceae bacterium]MBK8925088.1 ORF6N domain-containing protein [Crocinitomicaceae bacterium]